MSKKYFLASFLIFFVLIVYGQNSPPPPGAGQGVPVPIDGGLTALLVAGGAMGYRAMKKKREEL